MAVNGVTFNPFISSQVTRQPVQRTAFVNTNPIVTNNYDLKGAFGVHFNNGELSPKVDGKDSQVGQVLPRLYA